MSHLQFASQSVSRGFPGLLLQLLCEPGTIAARVLPAYPDPPACQATRRPKPRERLPALNLHYTNATPVV